MSTNHSRLRQIISETTIFILSLVRSNVSDENIIKLKT